MLNIKNRLNDVRKKQVDLIPKLRERGIKTTPSEISKAISGYWTEPKAERILAACNEIVTDWERRKET